MKSRFDLFLAGLLAALLVSPLAGAEQLTTAGNTADFGDFRTDSSGNLHLVWHDTVVDSGAIMYKLFNAADDLLIDDTQVNTGGSGNANTWPAMTVDSGGLVYVVWHDTNDGEIYFMRLNPFLAALDGMSTTQGTIKEVGDIRLSDDMDGFDAVHPRLRLDGNGDLHVVWESSNGGSVQYLKLDTDGTVLAGPLSLGGATGGSGLPDVAVDTDGHAHVVFGGDATTTAPEVFYAMINGATGLPLIDVTLLTVDDGLRAGSATISIDNFDNLAYIAFTQSLTGAAAGDEEIFMWVLDPSLDDQDGSTGIAAALMTAAHQLTDGEGLFNWSVFSRITGDRRIHVTYMDFDQATCPGLTPYTITDAHVTFAGRVVTKATLTGTGSATTCFPQARTAPGRNRIVWTDSATGTREIFAATIRRADAGSSGFTCSLGSPGSRAREAADLWLLLALVSALGIYRKYRGG